MGVSARPSPAQQRRGGEGGSEGAGRWCSPAARQRLRWTVSYPRRLEGPAGKGDARFWRSLATDRYAALRVAVPLPAPRRAADALCPRPGSREGAEGAVGAGAGSAGAAVRPRDCRTPAALGWHWVPGASAHPGLPLALAWGRGGRRGLGPGVGVAGHETAETQRSAGVVCRAAGG